MSNVLLGVAIGWTIVFGLLIIRPEAPVPRTVVHCPQYHHSEEHQIVDNGVVSTHVWCVKNTPKENYRERED